MMNYPNVTPERLEEGKKIAQELIADFLAIPDEHLCAEAKDLVRKFSPIPQAVEVLEVLDMLVDVDNGVPKSPAKADYQVIISFAMVYKACLVMEGWSHEQVVAAAPWRSKAAKGSTPDRSLS